MDYPFSIKDISSRVKKTEQSLYNLIKKNQGFIKQNSKKEGRFIKYNQAVMDWFIDYYGAAQDDGSQQESNQQETTAEMAQEGRQEASSKPVEDLSCQLLQAKIEALEAENAALRERLSASEEERKELQKQVGLALLSLQQEKQEKMLLLPSPPPPRKTFAEKVKGIFSGHTNKQNHDHS